MLKYLVGWFSRESKPLAHICSTTKRSAVFVFHRLQSANCHFSCTIFGIYISHTKRWLARQAVLGRQCSISNKECARVCFLSPVTSESPPSLCLFLFPSIRPSAPCSRTFLVSSPPENVAAGASSRPVLIYCTGVCVGIYISFTACTLLFYYLTRTFVLKMSVSVILSF